MKTNLFYHNIKSSILPAYWNSCCSSGVPLTEQNLAIFPSKFSYRASCGSLSWANVNFQPVGTQGKRVWNFKGAGTCSYSKTISIVYTIDTPYAIGFEDVVSGYVISGTKSFIANTTVTVSSSSVIGKTIFKITITLPQNIGEYSYVVYKNDSGLSVCTCDLNTCSAPAPQGSSAAALTGQLFVLYELTTSNGYNSQFNTLNVATYNDNGQLYILDADNGQGNAYWVQLNGVSLDSSNCLILNTSNTISAIESAITYNNQPNGNRLWNYNGCSMSVYNANLYININSCSVSCGVNQYQFDVTNVYPHECQSMFTAFDPCEYNTNIDGGSKALTGQYISISTQASSTSPLPAYCFNGSSCSGGFVLNSFGQSGIVYWDGYLGSSSFEQSRNQTQEDFYLSSTSISYNQVSYDIYYITDASGFCIFLNLFGPSDSLGNPIFTISDCNRPFIDLITSQYFYANYAPPIPLNDVQEGQIIGYDGPTRRIFYQIYNDGGSFSLYYVAELETPDSGYYFAWIGPYAYSDFSSNGSSFTGPYHDSKSDIYFQTASYNLYVGELFTNVYEVVQQF